MAAVLTGPLAVGALRDFLEGALDRRFAWGRSDCLLMAADWAQVVTGRDPAAQWRGRYRTEIGARRILTRLGGLEIAAGRALAPLGAWRTDEPAPGDIGVVAVIDGRERRSHALGVMTPTRRWAFHAPAGVTVARGVASIAWRLPCPR